MTAISTWVSEVGVGVLAEWGRGWMALSWSREAAGVGQQKKKGKGEKDVLASMRRYGLSEDRHGE
jgi:hypothetical protein